MNNMKITIAVINEDCRFKEGEECALDVDAYEADLDDVNKFISLREEGWDLNDVLHSGNENAQFILQELYLAFADEEIKAVKKKVHVVNEVPIEGFDGFTGPSNTLLIESDFSRTKRL